MMSEAILESGQSPDSQETISDYSLLPEIDDNETSKNQLPDELQTSTVFSGKLLKLQLFSSATTLILLQTMLIVIFILILILLIVLLWL